MSTAMSTVMSTVMDAVMDVGATRTYGPGRARVPDAAWWSTVDRLGAAADERAADLDADCRLPDDLARDAVSAGTFRQLVAGELGGLGFTPLDWFRTGVGLAWWDASLAWVVTQGAAELGWIGAGADPAWAVELLADPMAVSASTVAGAGRMVPAGATARFGGRWAFNTGCTVATWIGGLAVVDGGGRDGVPAIRWGWVPADRARIVDDWDPIGLRGTGSHTTVIPEQEIPVEWTFDPAAPTANDRGAHRCLVGNGNWPIATSVAAVQLGNARRALDEATAIVREKAPPPDFQPLTASTAVRQALAEAEGLHAAATAGVEQALSSMWGEARALGELTPGQRVRLHRANVTANRLAVRVVDLAAELTGTSAIARRHPLARCRRDAHALAGHVSVGASSVEHQTALALGLEPPHRLV